MRRLVMTFGVMVLGLLAGVASARPDAAGAPARHDMTGRATPIDRALVDRGAYVARLGGCAACHTALHGRAYAGGLEIRTPIGAIYSPNITPDPRHGIGRYSFADFDRAVRRGVRRDGASLYPAMPYPAFARMTQEDMRALYAYFIHGVRPVSQANRPVEIAWPLSMRWPLAVWRALFTPAPAAFAPAPGEDPVVARGEYLVTGPGHCGACHTPRGFAMQEVALDARGGAAYLSGGAPIDNWVAPSLRSDPVLGLGRWSEEDLYYFLKSGRTDHAAIFGGMADVLAWSTRYFTDGDLRAIARYLKSLPAVPPARGDYVYDPSTAEMLDEGKIAGVAGAEIYLRECAVCHSVDGAGIPRLFPPLAGNPVVVTDDPTSVVNVVTNGGVLPPTDRAPSAVAMPAYGATLSPQQIADVVNFIRTGWGNDAPANVSPAEVARLRDGGKPISPGWNESGGGWLILLPQRYGAGWTFAPRTHAGIDDAQ
ncbi:cytochrome c [Nguyenibacter sp. L1]|uniref:cytochrome c n=1 Tax=Nguyenibacter sp. L1 TaxID=3049350 RepID=UPI002B478BD4|nr:cytochrome c [Nguyenibacter sp. L1]WRH88317.1 cytochrome c [Nguyenibacter sp. L1]